MSLINSKKVDTNRYELEITIDAAKAFKMPLSRLTARTAKK